MRCPACGFVSFDTLATCKRCGSELPPSGRPVGVLAIPRPEGTPAVPAKDATDLPPPGDGAMVVAVPDVLEAPEGPGAPADPAPLPRAGFWLRGVAFLVDLGVVGMLVEAGAILVGLAVRIGGGISSAPEPGLDWLEGVATTLFAALTAVGYFTLFVGWGGQTPGKMLLHLKVIRTTGGEVGYWRALVRWVGQCIGLVPLGLGFLLVGISRRKQGLHDKLAGTCVVRLPS